MQKKSILRALEMQDYAMMRQCYDAVGTNPAKKLLYAATENGYTREDLRRELLRIVQQMPDDQPKPAQPLNPIVMRAKERAEPPSMHLDAPEEVRRLVHRRKRLYGRMNYLYGVLQASEDKTERFEAAKELLNADDEIVEIWRQTDYYDQHGVLPSPTKPVRVEIESLSYAALMKSRNNLRTYISRSKNNPEKAEQVKAWQEEIAMLDARIKQLEEGDDDAIQLR